MPPGDVFLDPGGYYPLVIDHMAGCNIPIFGNTSINRSIFQPSMLVYRRVNSKVNCEKSKW